jgi:hypothetical protein
LLLSPFLHEPLVYKYDFYKFVVDSWEL